MKEFNTKNIMKIYGELMRAKRQLYACRKNGREMSPYEKGLAEDALKRINYWQSEFTAETEKLNALIATAEGKATERKLTSTGICDALETVNEKLGILKKQMEGVIVSVDVNAQNFPNAYKWRAQSTQFRAEYRNGSWRIVNIERDDCRRENDKFRVKLTDEAKAAIIENHSRFA